MVVYTMPWVWSLALLEDRQMDRWMDGHTQGRAGEKERVGVKN